MDTDLRASLIASGVAAILSMIVGAITGVGFLALVLRALVGGLVFGGLVYGAFLLLRRFLPEFFESQSEASGMPDTGGNLDIILPGDGELPQDAQSEEHSGLLPVVGPETAAAGEGAASIEAQAAFPGPAAAEPAPPRPRRSAVPPAEKGPRARQAPAMAEEAEDLSPFAGESLIDGNAPDEDEAVVAPAASARMSGLRPSDGLDDLDVLPDLESLSDGFNPMAGGEAVASGQDYGDQGHRSPDRGGKRSDADPAMLAQAVRTLLKRDQER